MCLTENFIIISSFVFTYSYGSLNKQRLPPQCVFCEVRTESITEIQLLFKEFKNCTRCR